MSKDQMDKKTWKETLKKFEKLPPPMIERNEQCYHERMEKIIRDDFTYRCEACNCLFDVYGCAMYTPEQYAVKTLSVNMYMADRSEKVAEYLKKVAGNE